MTRTERSATRWTRYRAAHRREAVATAAIFGYFAAAWFGWAQAEPPAGWRIPLGVGSVVALGVAVIGALLTWRSWRTGTSLDEKASRTFGVIVGIEVVLAALGIPVLAAVDHPELMPAWVGVVVGVHLLPLGRLFRYPMLSAAGAAVTVLSLVAVPVARIGSVPVSAVVGAANGTTLLAAAATSLVWARGAWAPARSPSVSSTHEQRNG